MAYVGQQDGLEVPRFAGRRTFARLPEARDIVGLHLAILGAPFDGATVFRGGTRFGPNAVRDASVMLRPYNLPLDALPFAAVQIADAGDAAASPIDITLAHDAIEAAARSLLARGAWVFALGGDHSVTLPLLRAAAAAHGPLALLQLDAHSDANDTYFGGARVTHGTIIRRAVEEGLIRRGASIQVGLRGPLITRDEPAQLAELGIAAIEAREVDLLGVGGVLDRIASTLSGPTYVSFDIDVLDPAFAPGTGTPEAGGLTSREALAILRGLARLDLDLRGADLVEVSPPFDSTGITAFAASHIAYDLVTLLAANRARHLDAAGHEPSAR